MRTYTAAQWALLLSEAQAAKLCLKIDRTVEDDVLLCSGENPVTTGGDDYVPRAIMYDALALGDPTRTSLKLTIDDADEAIRDTWRDERFSGLPCTVTLLLRYIEGGAWESVYEVDWNCRFGNYAGPEFFVELHAASGFRPRYGGTTATRAEFPYAPEPGRSIRLGSGSASFDGGPPGGGDDGGGDDGGFDPNPWDLGG